MNKLVVALLLSLPSVAIFAQDPIDTDGDKYKVVFENARVRVLDYRDLPGDKTQEHHHPDFVLYAVTPFERKIHLLNGKDLTRTFKAGDVIYSEGQTHTGENIGSVPTHAIIIELKTPAETP